ncbi:MAG: methionine synthase [Elusimicrobia bacterium RIFCSPLOWO2_02_FULL_39_32]|nr:MAG: methionine synthase [Elusimicrobia bacterium RIFCSPHIGHO2_02_FULL_39_36]OGR92574.1 MAG: methionine synthase [Elusimicrobia bacterium RIFCSPLOWO2_02_FULL_39_32]OGR99222.1 MAG: methionine synthase [Elusimicrobia bacterium RIFCSPLOWO2_12_FULL_39_28]
MSLFLQELSRKVLIFDGAMGTNIQYLNLNEKDFDGKEGCNEILVLTKPEAVEKIHESFFQAGCDAVETDTFGSNRIVLAEYDLADKTLELNEKAALLARRVAKKFSTENKPRFVIGSVGPTTKLPTLGHISFDEMFSVFSEQIQGLLQGGVDAVLIETCQDILQSKIGVIAANSMMDKMGLRVPIICQVTMEQTGTMLLGTEIGSALTTLEMLPIDIIGINCATGPREMIEHIRFLSKTTEKMISVLPNAGLPENVGGRAVYKLTPDEFANYHERFVQEFGVNIIGGCCGTTPEHLAKAAEKIGTCSPKKREIIKERNASSLYTAVSYTQEPRPLLIGERTNANGSRQFKKLLEKEDYEAISQMAKDAVKEGSHLLDVCVAYVGRNEVKDMNEVLFRLNQQVTIPLVIDSTESPVIEEALKRISGKVIINSINLEDGEERMKKICPLAKKYGAGLIALTIDEKGMAKDRFKKLEIAERIHKLATEKYGIKEEDLFFDTLTFTLGSGDEEFRTAGIETIEGIRLIKQKFPKVKTILGVSNISFGLDPESRTVLNSVFLHYAIEAGLDAAIVHVSKIIPLFKIEEAVKEICKRLILNEQAKSDPLRDLIAYFQKNKKTAPEEKKAIHSLSLEESLKNRIIEGYRENMDKDLEEALKKYPPLQIINEFLMDGMKVVGELFGSGKMQLPFVLQSAEVMKKAVAYLEPFMEKVSGMEKGKIVLATVKGDVHDIGKNLVDIILTNNGYKVFNLGIKQPIDTILQASIEHQADLIGLSGLLVKSTLIMKENLEEMNKRGISLPVICGGAALTRKYVEEDLQNLYQGKVFYGQDAFSALKVMEELKKSSSQKEKDKKPALQKKKIIQDNESILIPKRSNASMDHPIPKPPFWGYKILKNISLRQIFPYINTTALFKGQWQFKQAGLSNEEYEKILKEKVEPLFQTMQEKCIREKILEPKVIVGYYPCCSENDDLIVFDESQKKELTRFTFPRQKKPPFWCISDFFRPKEKGEIDVVGFQIVTIGERASEIEKKLFESNQYTDYLYLHGISVESAEALAELVHQMIRKDLGFQDQEGQNTGDLFKQKYQGSRYSFGYPACPNLEDQEKLFKILPAEKIGMSLTEEFELVPEQSTSAIIVHHPEAKYFLI